MGSIIVVLPTARQAANDLSPPDRFSFTSLQDNDIVDGRSEQHFEV
jgi:hypothetical protein